MPTPDQADEATNKAYVDSAVSAAIASDNARGLGAIAFAEKCINLNIECYVTYESENILPALGDLILLSGQTTASENGIYEVSSVDELASYVGLARASNFDSTEEFSTGSFVLWEKCFSGSRLCIRRLASDFALVHRQLTMFNLQSIRLLI